MEQSFSSMFAKTNLIGIFRGVRPDEAEEIIAAGIAGGLNIVEIPLNSPEPLVSIEKLVLRFGEKIMIGAGTVTKVSEVERVAAAGGQLIVTPYARVDVVEKAKKLGMIAVPGALTPTEIAAMHECGADAVKIFPADMMPAAILKSITAVLPAQLKLIPVGGIDLENMAHYVAVGAAGFGLGSALYRAGDKAEKVLSNAQAFSTRMRELKSQ